MRVNLLEYKKDQIMLDDVYASISSSSVFLFFFYSGISHLACLVSRGISKVGGESACGGNLPQQTINYTLKQNHVFIQ
ncbi:hypothetical protein P168DRAFT_48702 [Aspergillus campestris IBT 28561]|uniref:Uncharacterized protein n=1 Tax=Aspergillus campestris (strain IBT 28561) TaxID=1392248 RepID=A0A2I1CUV2_ASPC2|nr:uncharacterized protein P168DRAFT_48702 [Aspergillus campestris IBT 28561]PKY01410.1 hypothetical protein P168DRAFT_48702 [Aspergillus campestris IBT 28561]